MSSSFETSKYHQHSPQNAQQTSIIYQNDVSNISISPNIVRYISPINNHPINQITDIQRSISLEEPIPSSHPRQASTKSNTKLSDLHISLNAERVTHGLETVSEIDDSHSALLTPDSPPIRKHAQTLSNSTTSTVFTSPSTCSMDSFHPIALSPINKEQSLRDKEHNKCRYPNTYLLAEIEDIVERVMTKCTTKSGTSNASNTTNNNKQNNDENKKDGQNRDNNNRYNGTGSGGCNNNGYNGRDDDDDDKKKRNNRLDDIKEEEEEEEDEKDDNIKHKSTEENQQYGYVASQGYRAQGLIKISKTLTQDIVPNAIREFKQIENIYDFMDKVTAIALYDGNVLNFGSVIIFNYGFHDFDGNELYLMAERVKRMRTGKRNCEYVMVEQLYTNYEICDIYDVTQDVLPRSWLDLYGEILTNKMGKLTDIFTDCSVLIQNVITKWHRLPVYKAMNTNKGYNKQRLTFSLTKNEFINIIKEFICNKSNKKKLIPIIMFGSNGYRLEYVQIVKIRSNIDIGISYIYNDRNNTIKATGIHLNKSNILYQHQLIAPNHHCHCLDDFESDIDDLHIGNPDDDRNRIKDLKKKNNILKQQNKAFLSQQQQMNELKLQNKLLQDIIAKSMNNPLIQMPSTPIIGPISPQRFITSVTPLSISTPSISPILVTPYSINIPTTTTINSTPQSQSTLTFSQYSNAINNRNYNHCNISNVSPMNNNQIPFSVFSNANIAQNNYGNVSNININNMKSESI